MKQTYLYICILYFKLKWIDAINEIIILFIVYSLCMICCIVFFNWNDILSIDTGATEAVIVW